MSLILLGILNSQAAAAGGAGSFDLLEQTTLTSNADNFNITGLDSYSEYNHLKIVGNAFATVNSGVVNAELQMNDDTNSSRYSFAYYYTTGTGFAQSADDANNSVERFYTTQGDGDQDGDAPYFEILLTDFNSSDKAKMFTIKYSVGNFASTNRSGFVTGAFDQPEATTSIRLLVQNQWAIGSTFSIYGWK